MIKVLRYTDLMALIDITAIRELEDLITQAIYSVLSSISCFIGICSRDVSICYLKGLIIGRFNQQEQTFVVSDVIARDVPLSTLGDIISALESW